MARDLSRDQVVLFGGVAGSTPTNETWEWTGAGWHRRTLAGAPSPRVGAALAYDPVNRRLLLFGGFASTGLAPAIGETWAFDGSAWQQLAPAASPGPRGAAGIAADLARNRVVLQGGRDRHSLATVSYDETWEWDGVTWNQRFPVHTPPAAARARLAFDASVGRVVHVNADASVREWDGQDWIVVQPPVPLPERASPSVCSDPNGAGIILIGPPVLSFFQPEAWRWFGGTWTRLADPPFWLLDEDRFVDAGDGSVLTYGWSGNPLATHRYVAATDQWSVAGSGSLLINGSTPVCAFPDLDGTLVLLGVESWLVEGRDARRLVATGTPTWVRSLAHDAGNARVLAIDGSGGTHAFDGQVWTPLGQAGPALQLVGHHSGTGRFMAYAVTAVGIELWGLDANGWALVAAIPSANAFGTVAAMDAGRDTMVLIDQSMLYEWNGALLSQPMPPHFSTALLQNPTGGLLHLDGSGASVWDGTTWTSLAAPPVYAQGVDVAGQRLLAVTDHLHPFALAAAPDDPSVGAVVDFTMHDPAAAGRTWWLLLATDDRPAIHLPPVAHGIPLRVPLARDWLLAASLATGLFGALDAAGRATASIQLPNAPALAGFEFCAAALLLPSAAGATQVTNPVRLWLHR